MAGFNVGFDYSFLRKTFERSGDKYGAGSWIFNCLYDVCTVGSMAIMNKGLRLSRYRLIDFCEHFKIKIDAHDAMSDIVATRNLNYELIKLIKS
jgi:DNA polymerase III epsilon subunit-like protein